MQQAFALLSARYQLGWRLAQAALRAARRLKPIIRRGKNVYVLRLDDVKDVMSRPEDFSVAIFGFRMEASIGAFFLGMDPSPQYERESTAMRRALGVPDARTNDAAARRGSKQLELLRADAERIAQTQVEHALARGRELDVVSELANVVPYRVSCRYFGIPEHPDLLAQFERASYYVFAPSAPAWEVPAQRAGEWIGRHITDAIIARVDAIDREEETPNDVLERLIRECDRPEGVDVDPIRRSLAGTFSGATIPTSWLFVEAMDRLMRLPARERHALHRAAAIGDREHVRAYVVEAARFYPFPFFILRYAERDTRIGRTEVPAGFVVNLVIGSATLDQTAIPGAAHFRAGRPASQSMLFGHDMHACMGRDIAEAMLTEMALAVFARPEVRRAPGLRGYIQSGPKGVIPEGYYPKSFFLRIS